MLSTEPEKQRLAAALEVLEGEARRREDERIAAGQAVRLPLHVVIRDESLADAVERAKAHKLAALHEQGEQRNILFEPPLVITTGVPRSPEFLRGAWASESPAAQYRDRYTEERAARASRDDDELMEPPPPAEWHRFITTVRNPKGDDPGQIIEAEYSIQFGKVAVRDSERRHVGTVEIHSGDDVMAAARRIVREKRARTAFYDPIVYERKGTA
jgi:hypothetical protein